MEQIDNIQVDRKITLYAGIFFLLSVVPIFMLGRYNVMCLDDYNLGRRIHDTWVATGSFFQSAQASWQQSMDLYRTWEGTYASFFLVGISPTNFQYETAWVVPIIMVSMFSISTYVLGKHIMYRWMGIDKTNSGFVLFVLLFMYFQVMESPFDGLYWFDGALHYILMQSFWFFTLTLISTGLWTESRLREVLCCIAGSILAIIVGGGNLVTCLQAEIVMSFLIVYTLIKKRRKIIVALIPFMTGSTGFLINALAPGNKLRGEQYINVEGYSAINSILLSFYHAIGYIVHWTPAIVIVIWIALLPILWKIVKQSNNLFKHPLWVTMGIFCIYSAMFTPTLYVFGMTGYCRIDNIIQMVYYLCLIMVTAYWLGYLSHKKNNEEFSISLENFGIKITAICFLIAFVFFVFTEDKNTYTSISALRSIVNGDAQTFYTEAMERYDMYTNETIKNIEIKPYSTKPALFEYEDLSEDPGNWLNLAVAEYFHKESVRLVDDR